MKRAIIISGLYYFHSVVFESTGRLRIDRMCVRIDEVQID